MKKALITLLIVAAVAVPSFNAAESKASSEPNTPHPTMRAMAQVVARHLLNFRKESPLTADQRQKIRSVLATHRTEIRNVIERGREARTAFQASTQEPDSASSSTREAAEKIGHVARDSALLFAQISSEMKPILNQEQRDRLQAARDEMAGLVSGVLASRSHQK